MTKYLLLDKARILRFHKTNGQMATVTLLQAEDLFYTSPYSHDTRFGVRKGML